MTVLDLPTKDALGGVAEIIGFQGPLDLIDRLRELGLYEGATFEVSRRLPLQGPWVIQVGSAQMALRDDEIGCVLVKWVQE